LKYKAILFDLGSTLIEYENHDWMELGKNGIQAAHPYLKKLFPAIPEVNTFGPNFYKYLREILDQRANYSEVHIYSACDMIFKRMGLAINNDIVDRFVDIYHKPVAEQITLIPGAVDVLKNISQHNLTIGLVSNSIFPEKYHRGDMEHFGLLKYFDFTIFSSSVGIRKPGGEIFEMALEKAKAKPSEAIFIGDRFDADIGGAQNAGITAVLKYRQGRENPDNFKPDYEIINLGELKTIIF